MGFGICGVQCVFAGIVGVGVCGEGRGCGLGRRAAGAAASLDTNDRAARESSCNHAHNVMTDNLAICACTTHGFAESCIIPCMYCMHAGMRMVPMLIKYAYESMARVNRNVGMQAMTSLWWPRTPSVTGAARPRALSFPPNE